MAAVGENQGKIDVLLDLRVGRMAGGKYGLPALDMGRARLQPSHQASSDWASAPGVGFFYSLKFVWKPTQGPLAAKAEKYDPLVARLKPCPSPKSFTKEWNFKS